MSANDVAYWDGTQWHAFGNRFQIYQINDNGSEYTTIVYALAVAGSTVYIGGSFDTMLSVGQNKLDPASYIKVNNLVAWDRTSDEWFFIGPRSATEEPGVILTDTNANLGYVAALALSADSLYVGGTFNQAGSVAVSSLVRWNITANT